MNVVAGMRPSDYVEYGRLLWRFRQGDFNACIAGEPVPFVLEKSFVRLCYLTVQVSYKSEEWAPFLTVPYN